MFIPKRRKKRVFGVLRRHLGKVFHELASHKESQIVEGHLMGDHVHICISIPPKYAVSNVVGYLKGKSAIQIARKYGGRQKNFTGEHFWARGYFVSTVGLDDHYSQPNDCGGMGIGGAGCDGHYCVRSAIRTDAAAACVVMTT